MFLSELFEGDIIMDEQLRQAVLGEADKRSMTTNPDKRWKSGIVPYVFDPNIGKTILIIESAAELLRSERVV